MQIHFMKNTAIAFLCALCMLCMSTIVRASSYDIREGDELAIHVYQQDELSLSVRVGTTGNITYPYVGTLNVLGKNVNEVEKHIAKVLGSKGFDRPQVVVTASSFAPRSIFLLGEINSGGSISIPLGNEITAMQALSFAGGIKESGDVTQIVVRRPLPSGESEVIPVPAQEILMGKDVQDVVLKPNDTIVVPRARPVSILGEVGSSGQYYLWPDMPMTVSMAIARAGGTSRPRSMRFLRVIRGTETFELDIQEILEKDASDLGKDMVLEPGDILYVPETRW